MRWKTKTTTVSSKAGDFMSYGKAFDAMLEGHGVRIRGWPEKLVLRLQPKTDIIPQPYFYMTNQFGRIKVQDQVMNLFSDKWEIAD